MYLMGLWGIYACIQTDSWMIKYGLVTTAAERIYAARSMALKNDRSTERNFLLLTAFSITKKLHLQSTI